MRASSSRIDRGRELTETRALLPHLQALPEHESQKADEDVSLNAVFALMPYRPDVQLVLLDPESGFGLCKLDVIPEALSHDVRPSASSDGSDAIGVADQKMPRILASGDDGLVAVPYQ